ncbi:hypothetical protein VTK26DRAFT_1775 [Humicola hyalothermophila]
MPPQPDPDPGPDSSSLPLDQSHILLTAFNSFLTVAIHNILYYRNIYPPATFLSTKAYNLPVHQNRHPKVCAWIRDAVDAVAVQLTSGHVARIAIVIHSPLDSPLPSQPVKQPLRSGRDDTTTSPTPSQSSATIPPGSVLERWLIDTSRFPAWPTPSPSSSTKATAKSFRDFARVLAKESRLEDSREALVCDPASSSQNNMNDKDDDDGDDGDNTLRWPDLDEQLRGALRRMATTAEAMAPLPEGCTFTVAVELAEEGRAPIGHPQAWIPSEPNLQPASKGREMAGEDLGGVKTRPIRSVEAGPLFFECWVEEGKAKEVLTRMMEADKGE